MYCNVTVVVISTLPMDFLKDLTAVNALLDLQERNVKLNVRLTTTIKYVQVMGYALREH